MKICFLAGSNSTHSHKWINFFANMGHEVIWISLVPSTIKVSNNIEYYEFTSGIFSSIYKVRKLILKLNPDIVHIHYLGYYALLGLFSGAKCIVSTPWGSDINVGKKSFFYVNGFASVGLSTCKHIILIMAWLVVFLTI